MEWTPHTPQPENGMPAFSSCRIEKPGAKLKAPGHGVAACMVERDLFPGPPSR